METELNTLIEKFQLFKHNINGTNEFDIFTSFYNEKTIALVQPWVQEKFNKTSIKSANLAEKIREDGNNHFKNGCNVLAVLSYTKSIVYAPFNSLEFNLSLGNRSAGLYHLGKFQACIQDLELCIYKLNYPENKKFKLYQRLIQTYIDLKLGLKAKQVYVELVEYLRCLNDDDDLVKFNQIAQNLNGLIEIIIEENQPDFQPPIKCIPIFSDNDLNDKFQNASKLIKIKFEESKGRHVIATSDIKPGDILFIEKTMCFVPIHQEESSNIYKNICYHCFQETYAPIPCINCNELFCSISCRDQSNTSYHTFECVGSCTQIWKQIGVNFLAFRIFLFGFQNGFLDEINEKNTDIFHCHDTNSNTVWYTRICSLISNVRKEKPEDLLPHLVSTLIIVSYLRDKTFFYDKFREKYGINDEEEITQKIGGRLLRHILQIICNASVIEGVQDEYYQKFNSDHELRENGMFVMGSGVFPSISLMNHSCDSNITNYFIDNTIIIKANRFIKNGAEIFNCYGHDCTNESTNNRKAILKFQYHFDCSCIACVEPSRPEIYENGISCPKCNNCAINPIKEIQIARCLSCNYEFITEEIAKIVEKSDKLYQKWQTTNNIKYLEQCYEMEQKIYYKYNYKLYDLTQDLHIYYKNSGSFSDWWKYTEIVLDLDKKIYGNYSLKYGLSIRQTLITINKSFVPKTKKKELLPGLQEMFELSKQIFDLYYPKNQLKYNYINNCLKKIM